MLLRYCREFVADGCLVGVISIGNSQDLVESFREAGVQIFNMYDDTTKVPIQNFFKLLYMINNY